MKKIVSILLTISLCTAIFFTTPNINSKTSVNFSQNLSDLLNKIYYEYSPSVLYFPEVKKDTH